MTKSLCDIEQNKYDNAICKIVTILFLLPIMTSFFNSIFVKLGIGSKISTYIIYLFVLSVVWYKVVKIKLPFDRKIFVFIYFILLLILIFNLFFFEYAKICYEMNFVPLGLNLLLYIPVGFLCVYVREWKYLFEAGKNISLWILIFTGIGIFLLDFTSLFTYMEISNALLPAFLLSWYLAINKRQLKHFVIAVAILLLQLFYGGRMSFFSCIAFIVLFSILNFFKNAKTNKKNFSNIIFIFFLLVLGVFLYINMEAIYDLLGIDSRNLGKLVDGSFGSFASRDSIYNDAINIITSKNFTLYGLFGDRVALSQYTNTALTTTGYVHNIFLEFIISFGWGVGIFLICLFMCPFIFRLIFGKNMQYKIILIFFMCLIFLRLLVSGSWLVEGYFFVFIGVIFNKHWNNCKIM